MPNRWSATERWDEKWYRLLPPDAKLVYEFVFSACDIAGFYEWDEDNIAFHTKLTPKRVQRAQEGLAKTFESNGKYVWIPNFTMIQGNWPLNPKVGAHRGVLKRLNERSSFSKNVVRLLDGEGLSNGYEGDNIGLFNPTSTSTGNSKSKSTGKSNGKELPNDGEDFELFWNEFKAMNRGVGKVAAKKAWHTTTFVGRPGDGGHRPIEFAVLIQAAKHYRMSCEQEKTDPKFIKQPATFLGPDRNWEDWKDKPKPSSNGNGTNRALTRGAEEFADVFEEA